MKIDRWAKAVVQLLHFLILELSTCDATREHHDVEEQGDTDMVLPPKVGCSHCFEDCPKDRQDDVRGRKRRERKKKQC